VIRDVIDAEIMLRTKLYEAVLNVNIQRDGFCIPTFNVVYQQYISINEKSFGGRYNPIKLP